MEVNQNPNEYSYVIEKSDFSDNDSKLYCYDTPEHFQILYQYHPSFTSVLFEVKREDENNISYYMELTLIKTPYSTYTFGTISSKSSLYCCVPGKFYLNAEEIKISLKQLTNFDENYLFSIVDQQSSIMVHKNLKMILFDSFIQSSFVIEGMIQHLQSLINFFDFNYLKFFFSVFHKILLKDLILKQKVLKYGIIHFSLNLIMKNHLNNFSYFFIKNITL